MRALTSSRCTTPIPLTANTPPSLSLKKVLEMLTTTHINTDDMSAKPITQA